MLKEDDAYDEETDDDVKYDEKSDHRVALEPLGRRTYPENVWIGAEEGT